MTFLRQAFSVTLICSGVVFIADGDTLKAAAGGACLALFVLVEGRGDDE